METVVMEQERMDKLLNKVMADVEGRMKVYEKEFVLRHTFANVDGMQDGMEMHSTHEDHFGISWYINIERIKESLACYVGVDRPDETLGDWRVETVQEVELVLESRQSRARKCAGNMDINGNNYGWPSFIEWERMKEEYLEDGRLEVVARVKVAKQYGIVKPRLRCFDSDKGNFWTVAINVGDVEFYVSKDYLASQSDYFRGMFYGGCKEARQEEVILEDIDAQDFQNFLEVLYGEPAIDDYTIEGILSLNDIYDVANVRRLCEEFLVDKSEKSMKKKLELTVRFRMKKLMKRLIDGISTREEIKIILGDFDPDEGETPVKNFSLINALLKKSLDLV